MSNIWRRQQGRTYAPNRTGIESFHLYDYRNGNNLSQIACGFFEIETPAFYGVLKRWNGASWVVASLKVWNGLSFEKQKLKVYNGSSFQEVETL